MRKERQNRQAQKWLQDKRYEAVLRATRTAAFEFNPRTRRQEVSPFIGELVAGSYDGRLLSDVMLADGVIHPEDRELSLQFRDAVMARKPGEMTLRLLTPGGDYHWFRMSITPCEAEDGEQIFVGVLADVDGEMRQRKILRYRAEYDPVSGIYNKATFFEKTERLLSSESEQPHVLLRFDVDRFKIINELYSVSEGDLVLRHIGSCIQEVIRPGETYGRLGNDVFCLCLRRSEMEAVRLLRKLEERVNRYPIVFQFILSAGLLLLPRYGGEPVNILCDRAAMAQRTIKGSYIQRWAVYERSMSESLNREHYITGCMEQALGAGEFQIYLQPKVEMVSGRIVGAEALARWNRPGEGLIPPGEFVPLFERNGFILKLDEHIWELACRTLRDWLDRGLAPEPISVNVSRIHMHDPGFCAKVVALSERYQIPPRLLELEITESAYTECPNTLYAIMDRLQEMGFVFLMDDFGSGYSSLNVLKDIPVDAVKIDLNFLRQARRGRKAEQGVLAGTVRLVQGLELPVIAEGVETPEQADFLRGIGCTLAQGYYYSQPLPVAEFERLLWSDLEQAPV